jgi:hypothetical protein
MKWDYLVEQISFFSCVSTQAYLEQRDAEGWELVSIDTTITGATYAYFKREKQSADDKVAPLEELLNSPKFRLTIQRIVGNQGIWK